MKIMKRNGSEAAFDREKIAAAVTKANLATDQPPELSGGQVAQLALSVEQRSEEHTGPITHFTHKQIITRQQ